jgi:hypothetical protein
MNKTYKPQYTAEITIRRDTPHTYTQTFPGITLNTMD